MCRGNEARSLVCATFAGRRQERDGAWLIVGIGGKVATFNSGSTLCSDPLRVHRQPDLTKAWCDYTTFYRWE